ncbi:FAD-dependent oxidoreductase [Trinickia sp. EG282A]|uniref:FAD-dependent oxidoreductase n=1 Tax=Trinickia sp. EG282A TaxID=3237013 RepID=UPI0034D24A7D
MNAPLTVDADKRAARRAIVIGAGMAGLLAARVLADHFDSVHIVERDELPNEPSSRKGVPQARYVHQLLMRGRLILEQFFPGIENELLGFGAVPLDWYADVHWFGPAGWMARTERGFATWSTSRDLLEFVVRRRVLSNNRITLHKSCEVVGLVKAAAPGAAASLRVRWHTPEPPASSLARIDAALVVDASGRSSHMPVWLRDLGCETPQETVVNAFVGYASRIYRIPSKHADAAWKALVVHSRPPLCLRSGTIFPMEGKRWIVTLTGASRDYPPADDAGFLEFARSLRSQALYESIVAAEPLSAVHHYRRMENRLRHYERVARWPEGIAVVGDAVCGFNPVYGQGMTIAAIDAQLLHTHLREAAGKHAIGHAFQRDVAAARRAAWTLSTGVDYRYEKTQGPKRAWHMRVMQRYMDHVVALAAERGDVYRRLLHVMHMLAPPLSLLAPDIATRIALRSMLGTTSR